MEIVRRNEEPIKILIPALASLLDLHIPHLRFRTANSSVPYPQALALLKTSNGVGTEEVEKRHERQLDGWGKVRAKGCASPWCRRLQQWTTHPLPDPVRRAVSQAESAREAALDSSGPTLLQDSPGQLYARRSSFIFRRPAGETARGRPRRYFLSVLFWTGCDLRRCCEKVWSLPGRDRVSGLSRGLVARLRVEERASRPRDRQSRRPQRPSSRLEASLVAR